MSDEILNMMEEEGSIKPIVRNIEEYKITSEGK